MIFPLRVFGSPSAKRICSGRASAPTSLATCPASSFFSPSSGSRPFSFNHTGFSVTNATIALPLISCGTPTTAASATA